jgi:hypothetical protein
MSHFFVADLAVAHKGSMWLTTATVAHRLEITVQWVRALARAGELLGERTESGQWVFRREDVRRYRDRQDDARTRSRRLTLALLRPRMVYSALEPRQLSLLPLLVGSRLRMARVGERLVSDRKVKAPGSLEESRGSESRAYVNRKIAGGRR